MIKEIVNIKPPLVRCLFAVLFVFLTLEIKLQMDNFGDSSMCNCTIIMPFWNINEFVPHCVFINH